ncbi:MAG: Gfo/Idh/MocA family protein [Anaerolineae bacterium]
MSISLGLVGLGSFGRAFADLFMAHPLVDRIALCDREPERMKPFANKPSWQGKLHPDDLYPSLDAICATSGPRALDALVIMTQPWLHAPQAIQALEAGKHVYSAVPVISIPDADEILEWCDRLVRTVETTGLHYMLGETTYYRPQAMYCRRRARSGDFGDFVYAEGEYFHDVDAHTNLRDVRRHRLTGKAGDEWLAVEAEYRRRGVKDGPMHYPTHSTSGPISVMAAHPISVVAWGYANRDDDPYFADSAFSNETALFYMSNGATMRICEFREIGHPEREIFRVYGTEGSFENDTWTDTYTHTAVTIEEMRDPLPPEVVAAFEAAVGPSFYGGHGGSHAYLVHEFVEAVANDRTPAINVWEAVRYMAAGATAHKSALQGGKPLDVPDWGDPPTDRKAQPNRL